ncbi:alpha/beta fold hydrolase [Natronolimnohabitans innermongolicus]|uniref:Poly(R)-hydroxyalkanoic acid synthase, class III, PhaC subunit n=1 Tax=Natronolimnohabitans innermongolicus JCM 12255 TaxID=1227499 RepID=L9X7G3_9EURY|nr:alpha/beta fold hydrolase [Natronolimnohabitans innermongolicus]ELY57719.1 poly(R)-hydroxyalkanoic acid synthase, class III, PhaC subunit [Natronolimnohabitans innermongolicus JCM 12255]
MDPCEFYRQAIDRAARTPAKLGQAPLRMAQLATAEPGATPYEIVYEEGPVSLRRYEPRVPESERRSVPLVIAYPFINDPSILDFAADRSVVRAFADRGFPVYVVEWGDPTPLDRSLGLGDYVCRFLRNCVDYVREETGADAVHLHGYSTSAPLSVGYAGCFPEDVRTLVLQGPPLAFDAESTPRAVDGDRTRKDAASPAGPSLESGAANQADGIDLFRRLAAEHDPEQVADAFDVVPTPLLEVALALRKPVEYTVTNPLRLWDQFDDAAAVEEYGRKLSWASGGPNLPGTAYEAFVRELLVENRLLEGTWELCGRPVDLDRIGMPVLLILGAEDRFVPPRAALPFLEEISSEDTTVLEFPTGHVGTSVAAAAHEDEEWWPRALEWVAKRSD